MQRSRLQANCDPIDSAPASTDHPAILDWILLVIIALVVMDIWFDLETGMDIPGTIIRLFGAMKGGL